MIDGVRFGEHVCVVALGIGLDGTKHPFALVEGSTEDAEPKTLRYRLLHVAARLTHGQRRNWLRIQHSWPWAPAVVQILRSAMLHAAHQASVGHPVTGQLGVQNPWDVPQSLEEAEEFLGRRGVTPGLNEDVQHLPGLINRMP